MTQLSLEICDLASKLHIVQLIDDAIFQKYTDILKCHEPPLTQDDSVTDYIKLFLTIAGVMMSLWRS
jgi:hypothetical protein